MTNYVVIGGNGGIGLALCELLAQRYPDANVLATYRRSPPVTSSPNIQWFALDLESSNSVSAAVDAIRTRTESLRGLFVCSGWLHDAEHKPERSYRELDSEHLIKAYQINAALPLLAVTQLVPLLSNNGTQDERRAKIIMLSAKIGSVKDNGLGGWHSYRMSKTALNMGVRNLGIEFSRRARLPLISAVHPGTTDSALSEPFSKKGLAVVAPSVTAERLLDFFERMSSDHQGGFYHWDGETIPW